ncbi:MAG: hypothetical protein IT331_03130 [Anaerolineae bacterium]|nr:hypothetical protein [Anaerolineae bacterium]
MKKTRTSQPETCHYFVDEAGDGTLFSASGRVIIGTEGCTRFFILGLAEIENPDQLASELDALRAQLLADPYFKNVPSMQPAARKTALAFHAKDDLPEVRREVFAVLSKHPIRFFAVVRTKSDLLNFVRTRNRYDSAYRYNPNELYDNLVARLFNGKLHKAGAYRICFAQRGKTPRTDALRAALEKAQANFQQR